MKNPNPLSLLFSFPLLSTKASTSVPPLRRRPPSFVARAVSTPAATNNPSTPAVWGKPSLLVRLCLCIPSRSLPSSCFTVFLTAVSNLAEGNPRNLALPSPPSYSHSNPLPFHSKIERRAMGIFEPYRAIGCITSGVPFSVQRLGTETFVTVSVGKAWQIYDVSFLCCKVHSSLVICRVLSNMEKIYERKLHSKFDKLGPEFLELVVTATHCHLFASWFNWHACNVFLIGACLRFTVEKLNFFSIRVCYFSDVQCNWF